MIVKNKRQTAEMMERGEWEVKREIGKMWERERARDGWMDGCRGRRRGGRLSERE